MPDPADPFPAFGKRSRIAAGHATAAVLVAAPYELAGAVVVLDGGSVVGALPGERLLAASAALPVRE